MALTFPRALPTEAALVSTGVRFDRAQATAIMPGAANPVSDLGDGVWRANLQSAPLLPAATLRAWKNWRQSLRGALRTFLMTDPDYAVPAAHPGGSGWGSPVVAAFDQAAGTIDLSGLTPSTAVLSAGDRFHIVYGTSSHYAYHEITEGGTADGSGLLTIAVDEPILDGIATSDALVFTAPKFEAYIVPGTWDQTDGLGGTGSFKFDAMQVVRA